MNDITPHTLRSLRRQAAYTQGWHYPSAKSAAHYFLGVSGTLLKSLCGSYDYLGPRRDGGELDDTDHTNDENCPECMAKRLQLLLPSKAKVA